MTHHRIRVASAKRSSGHPFDFRYDLSGVTSGRALVGKTWMCAVEWCDAVAYSETSSAFARDLTGGAPGCILLQIPELAPANTWESWSESPGGTLAMLQNYCQYGYYGITAETPYLRRAHLGIVVQGDRINQAGSMRFRLVRPDAATGSMVPLQEPNGTSVHGRDFAFSLVFWEVDSLAPDRPIPGRYDFFKVWLSSRDRMPGGTPGDCVIPLGLSTSGSMSSGRWQVCVESFSTLKYPVADYGEPPRGFVVVSDSFPDANSTSRVLHYLPRSHRQQEEGYIGLRLSTKPAARDHVGHPVHTSLDSMASVHVGLRAAATELPLDAAATSLSEWVCCLTFYRTD